MTLRGARPFILPIPRSSSSDLVDRMPLLNASRPLCLPPPARPSSLELAFHPRVHRYSPVIGKKWIPDAVFRAMGSDLARYLDIRERLKETRGLIIYFDGAEGDFIHGAPKEEKFNREV